jgi:hypothetical protein
MSEFEDDLKRLKYVKRLINKYKTRGDLKERLILNHIIILGNVFGVHATVRMLFFRLTEDDYATLKTFLLFLNYMPSIVDSVRGRIINSADITIDFNISKRLREIR